MFWGIVLGTEEKAVNKMVGRGGGGYLLSWRLHSNEGRPKNKLKKSHSTLVGVKCYEEKQDRTRKMENARF